MRPPQEHTATDGTTIYASELEPGDRIENGDLTGPCFRPTISRGYVQRPEDPRRFRPAERPADPGDMSFAEILPHLLAGEKVAIVDWGDGSAWISLGDSGGLRWANGNTFKGLHGRHLRARWRIWKEPRPRFGFVEAMRRLAAREPVVGPSGRVWTLKDFSEDSLRGEWTVPE